MIAYSFSMASFYSKPYGSDSVLILAEAGPSEYDSDNTYDFTEENYEGDDLLADLLANFTMPPKQRAIKAEEDTTKSSEKINKTAWGSVDEWETAYEAYFWMHVQSPNRNYSFWGLYNNDMEAPGQLLRDLPIGEPVDLRAYFDTPGVRDFYKSSPRAGTSEMPLLEEFLNRIDEYQANLGLGKPVEEKVVEEEVKWDDNTPAELEYRQWLECAGRPRDTQAERDAIAKQNANSSHPCYRSKNSGTGTVQEGAQTVPR